MNTQPRRSPEPGRPFVNRGYELQLIQNKLDIGIQGKPMPSVVVCFWGAFGMGKSWLLLELERRHKRVERQIQSAYPTITVRLDLSQLIPKDSQNGQLNGTVQLDPNQAISPILWQDGQLNREALIQELWEQLASQLGTEVLELGRASAEEWAEAFVKEVTAWSAQFATPIIMLDTVDDLITQDESTFFWLEQHLVERLSMTDRIIFIFTSRGELRRWKRFQVRRRVDSYKLTAFDADTAGAEVGANREVSKELYRHAFGHPLFTERLGTFLEEQGINLQMAEEKLRIESSILRAILAEVINEILETVPKLPAQLARYACVLRWVSVEPLRFLAEELGPTETNCGDAYYLDLIGHLQAHHLLYWNSDKNCYQSDPVLRQLLAYFLKLDEPERFFTAHLAAFNFHGNHLYRYPQYLARYVPELAYHRTMLADCQPPESQPPTLKAWWAQFFDEYPLSSVEPWTELVEAIEQDTELKNILPLEDYEYLYSAVQKRATKAIS